VSEEGVADILPLEAPAITVLAAGELVLVGKIIYQLLQDKVI
jgi:hypothetical protein